MSDRVLDTPEGEKGGDDTLPIIKTLGQGRREHPEMHPPIIHGLLREGETINIVAPPKSNKSWLVADLAISIATGRPWLDRFEVEQGNVLLLDAELHEATIADRFPRVAEARGVDLSEIDDAISYVSMRGQLRSIIELEKFFETIEPGQYKLVIVDALYRFMPDDFEENSNGGMARIFNAIDRYAAKLRCAFAIVHHTSKGNQSGKSVTDVGAGAGSQSRAADSHLVLREHSTPGVAVLDASNRSFAPITPICLTWEFPRWVPTDDLDPSALKGKKGKTHQQKRSEWGVERFVQEYITDKPQTRAKVMAAVKQAGTPSLRQAKDLLDDAVAQRLVEEINDPNPKNPAHFRLPQPPMKIAS